MNASPDAAYESVLSADLADSGIVRLLLRLRSLPARALGRECSAPSGASTLRDLLSKGFFLIDEQPGREVVLGNIGRFWRVAGGGMDANAEDVFRPLPSESALAIWNFRVTPYGHGSIVSTETRIRCSDQAARRRFKFYWSIIGPFSGLIRMEMLKTIKRDAEPKPRTR